MFKKKKSHKFKLPTESKDTGTKNGGSFKRSQSSPTPGEDVSPEPASTNTAYDLPPEAIGGSSDVTLTFDTYSQPVDVVELKSADAEEYATPYEKSTPADSSSTTQNSSPRITDSLDLGDISGKSRNSAQRTESSVVQKPSTTGTLDTSEINSDSVFTKPTRKTSLGYTVVQRQSADVEPSARTSQEPEIRIHETHDITENTDSKYSLMESSFRDLMDADGYSLIPGAEGTPRHGQPVTSLRLSQSESSTSSGVDESSASAKPIASALELQELTYEDPWNREQVQKSIHDQVEEKLRRSRASAAETDNDSTPLSPASLQHLQLSKCPWYHGQLNREATERLLWGQPHGTFLVRLSSEVDKPYTLSFVSNGAVVHMHVTRTFERKYMVGVKKQGRPFDSLQDLITAYRDKPLPAKGADPVKLTHAVNKL